MSGASILTFDEDDPAADFIPPIAPTPIEVGDPQSVVPVIRKKHCLPVQPLHAARSNPYS